MLVAGLMRHPVAGPQVGRPILQGAAKEEGAFEAFVGVEGSAPSSWEAGQVQGRPGGGVFLDEGDLATAQAAADPAPL